MAVAHSSAMKRFLSGLAVASALALALGCEKGSPPVSQRVVEGSDETLAASSKAESAASEAPPAMTMPDPELAVIKTAHGEMTLEFWPDVAPNTVANFKKLAKQGFYNATAFHRIVKGFMIQGGDPNTKNPAMAQKFGQGGPGYMIKAEFNNRKHVRGVLSMARSSNPDSAGSQFFICHGEAPFLNGKYTAFGKLIKGDDVLEKIASIPTIYPPHGGGEKSWPVDRVEVESITIVPREAPAEAAAEEKSDDSTAPAKAE